MITLRKKRVVIYEDEKVLRELFHMFFTSLDYDVLEFDGPVLCPAFSGRDEHCDKILPCADVMIADYHMPRMTGVQLILAQTQRGCRLTPRNKAVISGDLDPEKVRAVVELGCGTFQKPFPFGQMTEWVEACEQRIDLSLPLARQRREVREPFSEAVACRVDRFADPVRGRGVNISQSGICLTLPVQLEQDEQVRFETDLPFPDRSGRVRWTRQSDAGHYLTGLLCA